MPVAIVSETSYFQKSELALLQEAVISILRAQSIAPDLLASLRELTRFAKVNYEGMED